MLNAQDVMNTNVAMIEREATVYDAAQRMSERRVGCLIVTVSGYPVGIVTETDLVRAIAKETEPRNERVDTIMSSPLFSTRPETPVLVVAATMNQNSIKKMPVIEGQRVSGIITQTDIVRYTLHAIEDLERSLTEGKVSADEFSRQATELFKSVPRIPHAAKHWHMICKSCGYRFLADEGEDGKLTVHLCKRCGGPITYDLAPPL
jgi:CBS domain-containing protein